MLHVEYSTAFKRDLKRNQKRHKNLEVLRAIMKYIEQEKKLSQQFKDHALSGDWIGYRELHIEPDWLLIYKIFPKENKVVFARTGTHADLFE